MVVTLLKAVKEKMHLTKKGNFANAVCKIARCPDLQRKVTNDIQYLKRLADMKRPMAKCMLPEKMRFAPHRVGVRFFSRARIYS
jgi:hypothetical protein